MGQIRLTATLVPRGPAAAVVLDDEQVAAVGEGAKRFPVVATVNDYTWRTTVTRMRGEFLLGLNREVREGAGVNAGDSIAAMRFTTSVSGPASSDGVSVGVVRTLAPTESGAWMSAVE
jgi:Domain of unknown function (DUF1905)